MTDLSLSEVTDYYPGSPWENGYVTAAWTTDGPPERRVWQVLAYGSTRLTELELADLGERHPNMLVRTFTTRSWSGIQEQQKAFDLFTDNPFRIIRMIYEGCKSR